MPQTTAERALAQAREARQLALLQLYQAQVDAFREQAAQAYREIIHPWWRAFVGSELAAQISLLMRGEGRMRPPRISERVRYLREDGRECEAYLLLVGKPRALELHVQQLLDGREPQGFAGGLFAQQNARRLPMDEPELPDLDLHPIVLIDFAEQISANIVTAYIRQYVTAPTG